MASPISPLAPASFPEMPNLDMVAVSTAAAGIKYQNRTDLALITFPESATVAGVFTQSETRSAAVDWCRQVLNSNSNPVGILVNSGNSNAFTGKRGLKATELSAELAAEALNCKP
ncbi:MAG: bifunctional ornithine acetyltransferase/N-acetylglutamate synthase, partial [Alphaproteobacteria bacterium]